jgi:type VI secretion system secreted protein Hcp
MSCDIFMKLDDVKGESVDASHKDEIEVLSWGWSMSQSGTSHSGTGAGSGKISVRDLSITKYVDKASPVLVKFCCSGKHFQSAQLTVRKAGGAKPVEYINIKLKDGLISSISHGGTPADDRSTETVTLNFASFTYEYVPQAKDGTPGASIPASWNIAKNAES